MAAENADMHAHSLSPLSRPVPMVGLSPHLTPYSRPSQPYHFLSPQHPFPLASHALKTDDDERDEASDLFDCESTAFSLYHSADQDDRQAALSPISAASLSPPSLASSASSVASVSSASPPPCSNCSCCSAARRLSTLVAGLKQKTAHTQSLVAVYQQTQQRLQHADQQLEQLNVRYHALSAAHQQCEVRDRRRREEDERRQVRLQAHESHIVQLKAALGKLQHEKDERTEKERSIKALQREKDGLTKQTAAMRAQVAAWQTAAAKHEPTHPAAAQTSAAADDVEWLPDTTKPQSVLITDTPLEQRPTAATAAVSSESEAAVFDVSRTMALAEAAITALKGEVRKRNDIIRQMRLDQRDFRKALKDAGITPQPTRASQAAATRKRRRRDSKPDREKEGHGGEMKPEELDAFAADVMNAMTETAGDDGGVGERVVRNGMGGCLLTVDGQEVVEEQRQEEHKEKSEDATTPVMAKKRGRPRIHPIKEKPTPVRRGSRKVKTEVANGGSDQPQPSSAVALHTPASPVAASPVTASTVVATISAHVTRPPRPFPHKPSAVVLQQATALLTSLLSASATDEADLLDRCLAMVCECPCSSHDLPPLSSLLPPSAPLPFAAPVLSLTVSSVDSCKRCLSSGVDTVSTVSCNSDDVLHWDELSFVALRLSGTDSTASVERWVAVLQRLDETLAGRHRQRTSEIDDASPSFLELMSYRATSVLLPSSQPLSQAELALSLTLTLLLHITRHTNNSAYVSCLLLSSFCSPQLSLSLLEHVAALHPQLLTHSPAQRTFHIKTVRLIAAVHLSQPTSQPSASTTALSSLPTSLYPSLVALLSSELSSLSSASRDFVFGRLQNELILHASVTTFSSPQHYQSLSASLLASFHLLFIHLTFPAAQSMVMSAILPAIPKAKSPLNSLVLLLTLPSLVTCALQHLTALSQRRPRPRKEESYTRAQLAAVLRRAMEGMEPSEGKHGKVAADSALLLRAGGCEVLLKALDELQERRGVKAVKDDEELRVLKAAVDGWLSGLSEAEAAVVCGAVNEKQASGWELVVRVKEEVRAARQCGAR